jgi:hypothetical protein
MKHTVSILLLVIISTSSCTDKEPKITSTMDISPEMKAYFVDYEVGTKWIYQDTLNANNFDTIELTQIEPYDTNKKGVLEKGYILHYKAKKNKDFKVSVNRGQQVNFYINIYTNVTGSGAVFFENYNGTWNTKTNYYDSIEIIRTKYYQVINSSTSGGGYYLVHVSKNKGICFFKYRDYTGGIAKGGDFKLVKTLKP